MKQRAQHPVTSSRSVRNKIREFINRHPILARGIFGTAVFVGTVLTLEAVASAKEKPTESNKPAISGEQTPGKKEILIADAKPGGPKEKGILVADSGKGTGVSASNGQAGADPLAGLETISGSELEKMRSPRVYADFFEDHWSSDFHFTAGRYSFDGVLNLGYNALDQTGHYTGVVVNVDGKDFITGDADSEKDLFESLGRGPLRSFDFRFKAGVSSPLGRCTELYFIFNGDFTEGNAAIRLRLYPDYEVKGTPAIVASVLRIQ